MADGREQVLTGGKAILAQWAGFFAGPFAWLVQLSANYALVPLVCRSGNHFVLHLVTLGTLLLVIVGAFLSWRLWRTTASMSASAESGGEVDAVVSRGRFMALLGLALSGFFGVLIVAQFIPSALLSPCK